MKLKQIVVSIENAPGRLYEVTEALGKAGINLRALNLVDTGAFGQLRLLVSDVAKARRVLPPKLQFMVQKSDVEGGIVDDEFRPPDVGDEVLGNIGEARLVEALGDLRTESSGNLQQGLAEVASVIEQTTKALDR